MPQAYQEWASDPWLGDELQLIAMLICKQDEPFDQVHDVLYFFQPGPFSHETVEKEEFVRGKGYAAEDPMTCMGVMYRKNPDILCPIPGELDTAPKIVVRCLTANSHEVKCREDRTALTVHR
jgi:hypothetical protein